MTEFPQAGLDAGREALRRFLAGDDDLNAMHTQIALIATETVPACDVASITMLRAGKPTTAAFTGKTALRLDETQYELGDGPCLAAIRHRGLEQVNTTSDDRWPDFVSAASDRGILATMSVPLGNDEAVIGALNLYSETHAEFDSAARDMACAFADQLGVAVASHLVLGTLRAGAAPSTGHGVACGDRAGKGHPDSCAAVQSRRRFSDSRPSVTEPEPQAPRHRLRDRRALLTQPGCAHRRVVVVCEGRDAAGMPAAAGDRYADDRAEVHRREVGSSSPQARTEHWRRRHPVLGRCRFG